MDFVCHFWTISIAEAAGTFAGQQVVVQKIASIAHRACSFATGNVFLTAVHAAVQPFYVVPSKPVLPIVLLIVRTPSLARTGSIIAIISAAICKTATHPIQTTATGCAIPHARLDIHVTIKTASTRVGVDVLRATPVVFPDGTSSSHRPSPPTCAHTALTLLYTVSFDASKKVPIYTQTRPIADFAKIRAPEAMFAAAGDAAIWIPIFSTACRVALCARIRSDMFVAARKHWAVSIFSLIRITAGPAAPA